MFERRCRDCGCTQHNACMGETGDTCTWVASDLCSFCAEAMTVAEMEDIHDAMLSDCYETGGDLVQLATEADANRAIAEHRAMKAGV